MIPGGDLDPRDDLEEYTIQDIHSQGGTFVSPHVYCGSLIVSKFQFLNGMSTKLALFVLVSLDIFNPTSNSALTFIYKRLPFSLGDAHGALEATYLPILLPFSCSGLVRTIRAPKVPQRRENRS